LKSFIITEQNVSTFAAKIAAWIREQVEQAQGGGVVLGMSGGIDCSVVARLCRMGEVDVHLILMPCGDDMKNTKSMDHAIQFIEKFNFPFHIFDIKPAVDALMIHSDTIRRPTNHGNLELSRVNLRPRVRMICLYQFAQLNNRLVIGTGNLAERTVGYFTKWGDGGCDLNPLAMITKQEVRILARYLDVPACIIDKKPSAGLWEGQTDEDELGMTYQQLDDYIISGTSGNKETDQKIEEKIAKAAHKLAPIPIFFNL